MNDLSKLGDKEILVLKDPYNTGIFSCFLLLLPCFFPLVVRPMMTRQEMFLKIIFNSTEFNCSIIFSR